MTLLPALLGMVAGVCVGALVTTDGDYAVQERAKADAAGRAADEKDIKPGMGCRPKMPVLQKGDAYRRDAVRGMVRLAGSPCSQNQSVSGSVVAAH